MEVLAAPDQPAPVIALDHLSGEVARFPGQIRRLILFGSQARGNVTVDSDVDVLVVAPWQGPMWRQQDRETGDIAYHLRHDDAPERHTTREAAAGVLADAEAFVAMARQLVGSHA
jgi:hypothetical protein